MKVVRISLSILIPGLFFAFLFHSSVDATLKYKKDTGKKCTFCHTGIPETGDEDPQLNEDGRKFRDNGYKLSEEQKRRTSS